MAFRPRRTMYFATVAWQPPAVIASGAAALLRGGRGSMSRFEIVKTGGRLRAQILPVGLVTLVVTSNPVTQRVSYGLPDLTSLGIVIIDDLNRSRADQCLLQCGLFLQRVSARLTFYAS